MMTNKFEYIKKTPGDNGYTQEHEFNSFADLLRDIADELDNRDKALLDPYYVLDEISAGRIALPSPKAIAMILGISRDSFPNNWKGE